MSEVNATKPNVAAPVIQEGRRTLPRGLTGVDHTD